MLTVALSGVNVVERNEVQRINTLDVVILIRNEHYATADCHKIQVPYGDSPTV
jgi:hypothetical protein